MPQGPAPVLATGLQPSKPETSAPAAYAQQPQASGLNPSFRQHQPHQQPHTASNQQQQQQRQQIHNPHTAPNQQQQQGHQAEKGSVRAIQQQGSVADARQQGNSAGQAAAQLVQSSSAQAKQALESESYGHVDQPSYGLQNGNPNAW